MTKHTLNTKEHIVSNKWHNQTFENLKKEKGSNFFYYINMLNLGEDEPLILSPIHHYYYDFEDLKNIKTIIQIKELNKISNLKKFFGNVSKILSPGTNFIGCFKDNKIYRNNIIRSFPGINWLLNNLGYKPNNYLSRNKVMTILNKYNLQIIDITEFDTLTYFYVKKR